MRIIGITGTIGAGKGTIVDYLMKKRGFTHYSVRGYLTDEIQKRGMPVNRDSMVVVANDLRAKYSSSFIIEELYKKALIAGNDCVIESLRTPGEVNALRQSDNFMLLAVDADKKLRYKRISSRGSETDHIDFKTFVANEDREMYATDPTRQNLKRCIEMADVVLINNGTVEELYQELEKIL